MLYGVDIGGTKIEIVAFDDDLTPRYRRRTTTPANDYSEFLNVLAALISEADAEFKSTPPIGLGMPGLVDPGGRARCANLPGVTGNLVGRDVAERIGRSVAMLNDTRCFALSEAVGGAGEGYRVVFGAILGTGAAGGLVIDGRVEDGSRGIAGEYGHLPLSAELQQRYGLPLRRCGCGLNGCLEAYVAGEGLLVLGRHFGAEADSTVALATRWQEGDPAAIMTRGALMDLLGSACANIVKLCDPDIIVLGGGLSLIPEIVDHLPGATAPHLCFAGFEPPPIVTALFGDASGVRGAAIVARAMAA